MVQMNDVLDRIKARYDYKTDADLARALEASPQNISNWRTRNTIAWDELLAFSRKKIISLDWILTGNEIDDNDSMIGWDADIREACLTVKKIYEANSDIKRALAENLRAFSLAVDKIKENEDMKTIIERLLKDNETIMRKISVIEDVMQLEKADVVKGRK